MSVNNREIKDRVVTGHLTHIGVNNRTIRLHMTETTIVQGNNGS